MTQLTTEQSQILEGLIRSYQENPESAKGSLLVHLNDELRAETNRLERCETLYGHSQTSDGNVRSELSDAFANTESIKGRTLCLKHQSRINKILRAQQMVTFDTFGECVECGRQIAPARLSAKIEAIHCIDCQNVLELKNAQKTRPSLAF